MTKEKQIREFNIEYCLDWMYGVELSEIKKDIEEIEKLGATHIHIESNTYYDCTTTTITAVSERMETDEEYDQRIKDEKAAEDKAKAREIEEFRKLKAKYGDA